jgi:parvulin-like peptidyl-prolyl isomerase
LAKKQKKATPERVPTKHQLSKWQRQTRIRRIVIIAAIVFLVGISSWVGIGYYKDYKASTATWREVMIEVNDVPFTMEYFVNALDAYANLYGMNSTTIYYYGNYIANMVADDIVNSELLRQGAESLNITVTTAEIDAALPKYGLPNDSTHQDIVGAILLGEKLKEEYFGPGLNNTMEQAHVQVMLVESQEVAAELIAEIEAGGNFTALAKEFSCNSSVEGDLGWLPEELMPNTMIATAAFNLTPGEISQSIYDETAIKDVGYWLIEVTAKQDDKINARAMLLGSEAEAEQVKAKLVSGNFSSLAMEYSQDKSKDTGGELGWLQVGNMSSTAFDQVAFNLAVNEVSEPVKDESVQTTRGYWLVKVIDRGDHELEEEVREGLINKHFNDWIEELAENSTIKTYLDVDKISWAINQVLAGR